MSFAQLQTNTHTHARGLPWPVSIGHVPFALSHAGPPIGLGLVLDVVLSASGDCWRKRGHVVNDPTTQRDLADPMTQLDFNDPTRLNDPVDPVDPSQVYWPNDPTCPNDPTRHVCHQV